ncbi:MAG: LamG domain-containing protein [Propionivibrio sp.]|uniref:LamG domain-containing protein n=1 Tax=Candidatus Propionivibrio dominans TaxID=2954373 RepID=A0A9D7IDN5_9RHOO|nr:LamG domain-containing protein [Candidatus Propionivibrio dominans]
MAIRFDASGDSLSRARLAGAKTVMAWVYITTDRNDYTVFFGLGSNELIGTGGDGTTLLHYDGTMERTGSNLSTGTWFHLAYVSNGDALANGFTVYLNGAADITYTVRSLTSAGTNMYLGNDEYSEWLNGRMAHVKIWNVALTAAEIQQEMYSSRPQRFANLWSWLPMIESGSGRNSEWSSSGNTWTANGTLADEDGPPVAWNLTGWQLPFVTSGGAAGQTLLPARIESTATVYSPALQPGAVPYTACPHREHGDRLRTDRFADRGSANTVARTYWQHGDRLRTRDCSGRCRRLACSHREHGHRLQSDVAAWRCRRLACPHREHGHRLQSDVAAWRCRRLACPHREHGHRLQSDVAAWRCRRLACPHGANPPAALTIRRCSLALSSSCLPASRAQQRSMSRLLLSVAWL